MPQVATDCGWVQLEEQHNHSSRFKLLQIWFYKYSMTFFPQDFKAHAYEIEFLKAWRALLRFIWRRLIKQYRWFKENTVATNLIDLKKAQITIPSF